MSLGTEIEGSRFLVLLLDEESRADETAEIVRSLKNAKANVCYVCLSRPSSDISEALEKKAVDLGKIYFVDALSAHYKSEVPAKNCVLVDSPANIQGIKEAVLKTLKERKCGTLILDTVSTLLVYQNRSNIVRFTHDVLSQSNEKEKVLYMALKNESVLREDNDSLVKDLIMFADKLIDLSAARKGVYK